MLPCAHWFKVDSTDRSLYLREHITASDPEPLQHENNVQHSTEKVPIGVSFNGGLSYPLHPSWNFHTEDFSLCFWVKVKPGFGMILSNREKEKEGYLFMVYGTQLLVQLSWGTHPRNYHIPPGQNIFDNRFHHITFCLDRHASPKTVINLFVDGQFVSATPTLFEEGESLGSTGNQLRIGVGEGVGDNFEGVLCDVLLYNRILSPFEIGRLYSASVEKIRAVDLTVNETPSENAEADLPSRKRQRTGNGTQSSQGICSKDVASIVTDALRDKEVRLAVEHWHPSLSTYSESFAGVVSVVRHRVFNNTVVPSLVLALWADFLAAHPVTVAVSSTVEESSASTTSTSSPLSNVAKTTQTITHLVFANTDRTSEGRSTSRLFEHLRLWKEDEWDSLFHQLDHSLKSKEHQQLQDQQSIQQSALQGEWARQLHMLCENTKLKSHVTPFATLLPSTKKSLTSSSPTSPSTPSSSSLSSAFPSILAFLHTTLGPDGSACFNSDPVVCISVKQKPEELEVYPNLHSCLISVLCNAGMHTPTEAEALEQEIRLWLEARHFNTYMATRINHPQVLNLLHANLNLNERWRE